MAVITSEPRPIPAEAGSPTLYFGVLGSLVVHADGRVATPTAPKAARVLAILLLRANRLVLAESLMEEIWAETPPPSAASTLQTYIYQLRCALGRDFIATHPRGYSVTVSEDSLDLFQFRARMTEGRRLLEAGRPQEAVAELRSGLSLIRGAPLDNLAAGNVLQPHIAELEEQHRRATQCRLEAEFAAGHHLELIGELKALIFDDPYNEWLHARLIEALSLSGRRRDALSAYESLRKLLSEHLGLQPTQALRDLERQVIGC